MILTVIALGIGAWLSIVAGFVAYAVWVWHDEAPSEGFVPCVVIDLDSYREHRKVPAA